MSIKLICDICEKEITDTSKAFGIKFSNSVLLLMTSNSTKLKHICYDCAKQLKTQLSIKEIYFEN